jgi:hypothetical protein
VLLAGEREESEKMVLNLRTLEGWRKKSSRGHERRGPDKLFKCELVLQRT